MKKIRRLYKNIDFIAPFADNRVIEGGYILTNDMKIEKIGKDPGNIEADELIDLTGYLVIPGFVNTHHHLFQTLTRNVPQVVSAKLFDWLVFLYEKWKNIDYEGAYVSAIIGLYEMMRSGVTTTTDMLYLYPYNRSELFDAEVEAAKRVGMRFHPTRGSMSLSRKDGGLPPDSVVQDEEEILIRSEEIIRKYHDSSKYSMLRVALAPCSPFSVTGELMIKTRELAEKYDVLLHTHLAETKDEEAYCLERFGVRPVDYMEKLGWLGKNIWFAHLVWLTDEDIEKLAKTDSGMAHCPTSNMRLGSGIAPVYKMKDRIRIGIAVDGSASNDTGNMLSEIRNTLLLQRVKYGPSALTPYEVLKMGTIGGAKVLRMDDYIGTIEEGKAADFIGFKLDKLEFSGGLSDPVSALVMCDARYVDVSVINGEIKVRDGKILDEELPDFIKRHQKYSKELLLRS